jgi:DnaJ-domain-containing protein 1
MHHFARFGLEPKPWIDPEILKQKFLELSAETHPDKASAKDKLDAEQNFSKINEAYNTLRNVRTRLLHLLEISGGSKQEHVQDVPSDALKFFPEVAAATKKADALGKEKAAAHSPMLKVQLMDRTLAEIEAMQELQERLRARLSEIEQQVKTMEWSAAPPEGAVKNVREAAAALGYLERWNAQLQERIGALTF